MRSFPLPFPTSSWFPPLPYLPLLGGVVRYGVGPGCSNGYVQQPRWSDVDISVTEGDVRVVFSCHAITDLLYTEKMLACFEIETQTQ